ncbi:hypothetical protein MPTK1_6g19420 [Marchantia polymorpha subsp. ruderalis]|uniref:Uncharacterized protein n=2 Tax=Marchantia polymorpha TaxID=3197 RepID=A0AAF6BTT3_MARPO|nr:hypothetical protein MARPO_0045s0121 [Marchantia polymorpha]BBN15417.1 hypothetical protein Mp_6g19420 [Marchantia polymorpha subsp. ruderalis]|eukprot:PTQ39471.1 hypothetical protein MARPO_0045s0121 [Marchantia polymorpha]
MHINNHDINSRTPLPRLESMYHLATKKAITIDTTQGIPPPPTHSLDSVQPLLPSWYERPCHCLQSPAPTGADLRCAHTQRTVPPGHPASRSSPANPSVAFPTYVLSTLLTRASRMQHQANGWAFYASGNKGCRSSSSSRRRRRRQAGSKRASPSSWPSSPLSSHLYSLLSSRAGQGTRASSLLPFPFVEFQWAQSSLIAMWSPSPSPSLRLPPPPPPPVQGPRLSPSLPPSRASMGARRGPSRRAREVGELWKGRSTELTTVYLEPGQSSGAATSAHTPSAYARVSIHLESQDSALFHANLPQFLGFCSAKLVTVSGLQGPANPTSLSTGPPTCSLSARSTVFDMEVTPLIRWTIRSPPPVQLRSSPSLPVKAPARVAAPGSMPHFCHRVHSERAPQHQRIHIQQIVTSTVKERTFRPTVIPIHARFPVTI